MKGRKKMENKGLQVVLSAAIAAFSVYFNALAVPLIVLLIAMTADYISGMTAAYISAELSSKKGIQGIVKKLSYMVMVVVAMGVDWLIHNGLGAFNINIDCDMWVGLIVTAWLIINEMISILENLVKIGVPMPQFLIKIVQKLKTSIDNKGSGD